MTRGTYSSGLGLTKPLRSGARGLQSRSPRSSFCRRRGLLLKGSHPRLNVLKERKQVIARKEYHHEEHEEDKVKSGYKLLRDLRVLRGRQVS